MPKTTLIDCRIKKYAYREVSQIYQELEISEEGLSQSQVELMRERYGINSFSQRRNDTMLRLLRRAFINPFNSILLVLGIISLATDVVLALICTSLYNETLRGCFTVGKRKKFIVNCKCIAFNV